MKRNYSRSVTRWLTFPLLCFLGMLLVSGIVIITCRIPALSKIYDFFYLIFLLIVIILPPIFALCGIPGIILSFSALRNQEQQWPILGKLIISGIYLAVGLCFSYNLTYYVLFQ